MDVYTVREIGSILKILRATVERHSNDADSNNRIYAKPKKFYAHSNNA
ncbi:MAG TPA: hypothetical protein VIP70_09795 [Nitrososphaeraceae archaeon]